MDKKTFELKPVDPVLYDRYMHLKFEEMAGAKFTEKISEDILTLEAELKAQTGRIAKKTIRAAIKGKQYLMIAGFPVPESFLQAFRQDNCEDYYLQPHN